MKKTKKRVFLREFASFVDKSETAILCTMGGNNYPDARAMLKITNNGLNEIWFSTNASSQKAREIEKNGRSCVYFLDAENWKGLKLFGTVQIFKDSKSRKKVWKKGFEKYYPKGVNDPGHAALRFRAKKGEYYGNLSVVHFTVPSRKKKKQSVKRLK